MVAERVFNNRESPEEKEERRYRASEQRDRKLTKILLAAIARDPREREKRLKNISREQDEKFRDRQGERPRDNRNQELTGRLKHDKTQPILGLD